MNHRVGLEAVLKPCVEGGECMVGRSVFGHQKPHGVPFVTEGGLLADENVAQLASENVKVFPVVENLSRGIPPEGLHFRVGREVFPVVLNWQQPANIAVGSVR